MPCPQLCRYIVSELKYVLPTLHPWMKRQYISKVLDLVFGKLCWQAETIASWCILFPRDPADSPAHLLFTFLLRFPVSHLSPILFLDISCDSHTSLPTPALRTPLYWEWSSFYMNSGELIRAGLWHTECPWMILKTEENSLIGFTS